MEKKDCERCNKLKGLAIITVIKDENKQLRKENNKLKKRIEKLEGCEEELTRLRSRMNKLLLQYSEEVYKKGSHKNGL